ncbi:MAG: hypothetical protein ACE5GO_10910 [Anaerolineales bacterium]
MRRRPIRPRRPFGPRPGAAPRPRQVGPRARKQLQQAHHLMETGRYPEAAAAFWRLAEAARDRGMLVRAGDLALQAARAHLDADDPDAALLRGRQGLNMLVRGGQPGRAMRLVPRMIQALRERDYQAQADALQAEADQRLAGISPRQAPPHARRGELPTHCATCGGPLRPDEVDWLDASTAECPYCGSPVKASSPTP